MPLQPVDATHALKRSAGVSNSNVSRGRSFNSCAILFNIACECLLFRLTAGFTAPDIQAIKNPPKRA